MIASRSLVGEGTLSVREVFEWARELDPAGIYPMPLNIPASEPLMVSVLPGPPDRRGLSGATVLR